MDFALRLREAVSRRDVSAFVPTLFDPATDAGLRDLGALLASPRVVVVDEMAAVLAEVVRTRRPRDELSAAEVAAGIAVLLGETTIDRFGAWAWYPWSDRLVHVLPETMHRELRLDRNRHKITAAEQGRLVSMRIGIVGLSVGRAIAATLVREGLGGEIRLADFDTLGLSNLNRLEGTLADVGINKAILAARQIVELDPYVKVAIYEAGITDANVEDFLSGLDVLVEECDDLAMKVELRERSRALGIPVVMATSDRGMLDIERFDLEPDREPFHGLLRGVRAADLRGLSTKDKVPYVLRIVDAAGLGARAAASLVEVKETLSTWPQLASDVVHGGAMVTNAVRRMRLGELNASGRFYVDFDAIISDGAAVVPPEPPPLGAGPACPTASTPPLAWPSRSTEPRATHEEIRFVIGCATRAPSGGNAQPWRFEAGDGGVSCFLDVPRATSLLDFEQRGSYLAIGAALENALVARAALGLDGAIAATPSADGPVWTIALDRAGAPNEDARTRVEHVHRRTANRRTESSAPVDTAELEALASTGAPLDVRVLRGDAVLSDLGGALGALDRMRLLSPRFHHELFGELRFTPEEAERTRDGIELASLELPKADLAALDLLRSAPTMEFLRRHDLGRALETGARNALPRAAAVLVLASRGSDRASIVAAGRGLARIWVEATARGLAVHPWGTPFLFQRLVESPTSLEPWERDALARAHDVFRRRLPLEEGLTLLMLLRISKVDPATSRSLRRDVDDVLVRRS